MKFSLKNKIKYFLRNVFCGTGRNMNGLTYDLWHVHIYISRGCSKYRRQWVCGNNYIFENFYWLYQFYNIFGVDEENWKNDEENPYYDHNFIFIKSLALSTSLGNNKHSKNINKNNNNSIFR